jgi:hypothetical protein
LQGRHVNAGFEQMGGVAVAKGMRRDVLGQPGPAAGPNAVSLQGGGTAGAVGGLPGEEEIRRPVLPPVTTQFVEQALGEGDTAVLLPFALADVDEHAARVEVGDPQVEQLAEAQAAGVKSAEDHARGRVGEDVEDGVNFGGAEDDGQGFGLLAVGEEGDGSGPLQDVGVKKAEGRDGLVEEAPGDALLVDEVERELPQVVRAEQRGRTLEVVGEATNAREVGFDSAW